MGMITSDRLYLRNWRQTDLPSLGAILGSPDVMAFSDHGPLDEDRQRKWLENARNTARHAPLPGILAIERRADATVIGYVSLSRDPARIGKGEAEIGFRLAEASWGQGYATEAATAVIAAAKPLTIFQRVVAIVDPNNRRSLRVIDKLGMVYQGDVRLAGYAYPDHIYARDLV